MKSKSTKSTINPEEDTAPQAGAKDLKRLVELAELVIGIEGEIAAIEERLATKNQELQRLTMETLPELMKELRMKDFSLANGARLTIEPIVSANLPSESAIAKMKDREEAGLALARLKAGLAYLEKQGAGSLIKNEVRAELGKDSAKLAKEVIAALKRLKVDASVTRGVHSATLNSWVRERLEAGKPVDLELFKVFTGDRAKIAMPKAKQRAADRKKLF